MIDPNRDPQTAQAGGTREIEVFYDGDCPLCVREVKFLRRLDRKQKIYFTNIAAADFCADEFGVRWDDFMSEIHGRLPDGTWVRGVEVFRRLYTAVGCGALVWMTRLPVIDSILDRAYKTFARNRLRWTGRCSADAGCGVEPASIANKSSIRAQEGVSSRC